MSANKTCHDSVIFQSVKKSNERRRKKGFDGIEFDLRVATKSTTLKIIK